MTSPIPSPTHSSTPQTDPTHQPKSPDSSDPPPVDTTEKSPQSDVVSETEDKPSVAAETDPTHQPKSPDSSNPPPVEKTPQSPEGEEAKQSAAEEGDDEQEEECGFCMFMKGGECNKEFTNWEKCVENAEKKEEDIVEKCFEITRALKDCMFANPEYYAPILKAEDLMAAEAAKELEKQKEREREENKVEKGQGDGGQQESVATIEVAREDN